MQVSDLCYVILKSVYCTSYITLQFIHAAVYLHIIHNGLIKDVYSSHLIHVIVIHFSYLLIKQFNSIKQIDKGKMQPYTGPDII
jgi:hypothetical protein